MLTRIDHVGIAVADLDEAISFYEDVLGLKCVHIETNEEQGVREAMLAVGGMKPHGPGGTSPSGPAMVQLLAPLRPDSPIGKFLDRSGPGIQQMAYTVDDIEATSTDLREKGVRLLYEQAKRGTGGALINFIHPKDAGGVLVELVEPARTERTWA